MRINLEHKTMDMETRDTDYFFQAYLLSYLHQSKNEDPVKIIMPKFPGFPHPRKPGVVIPIEWVEPDSPVVVDIVEDGKNVPIKTEGGEDEVGGTTELEQKPDEMGGDALTGKVGPSNPAPGEMTGPTTNTGPTVSPEGAKPDPVREPKQPPGGDLGAGHSDNLGSRNPMADRLIVRHLQPDAPVDESKEIDTDIEKPAV